MQEAIDKLQADVEHLGEVVNAQADIIERALGLNEAVVAEVVAEVNLVWSVMELPWWRRLRRLNRAWAVERAQVQQ